MMQLSSLPIVLWVIKAAQDREMIISLTST